MLNKIRLCGVMPYYASPDRPTVSALLAGGVNTLATNYEQWINMPDTNEDMLVAVLADGWEQAWLAAEKGAAVVLVAAPPTEGPPCPSAMFIPTCKTPKDIDSAKRLGFPAVRVDANILPSKDSTNGMQFIVMGADNKADEDCVSRSDVLAVECHCMGTDESEIIAQAVRARASVLGYAFEHLGINSTGEAEAQQTAALFASAFGFPVFPLPNSILASGSIEITKKSGPGANGHIAVRTRNTGRAIADLAAKGIEADMATAGYMNDDLISVYLKKDFGGFAVHLLQR